RQHCAPARGGAHQHRLQRGVLGPREEDRGRRHDLGHQRRAHEVLRGGEVPGLLVPRRRRPGVAGRQPEVVGRPPQGPAAGRAGRDEGDEPRGERVAGRHRRRRADAQASTRAGHDDRRSAQGGDGQGAQDRQGRLGHLAPAHGGRRQARAGARPQGPRAVIGRAAGVAALLAGFATLAIVLLISYDVAMRYFFEQPQLFVDEVASFLEVLVVFGGAAYTFRVGGHVRVDLVTGRLGPAARAWLRVVTLGLGVVFLAVVIWVTVQSGITAFRYGRVSTVML